MERTRSSSSPVGCGRKWSIQRIFHQRTSGEPGSAATVRCERLAWREEDHARACGGVPAEMRVCDEKRERGDGTCVAPSRMRASPKTMASLDGRPRPGAASGRERAREARGGSGKESLRSKASSSTSSTSTRADSSSCLRACTSGSSASLHPFPRPSAVARVEASSTTEAAAWTAAWTCMRRRRKVRRRARVAWCSTGRARTRATATARRRARRRMRRWRR
mmetsp:Transcript_2995/g.8985  ORF Transcript_2995/g.8985 Transcript_2995/m.8985 type:complete len:221 (-) Transcript_2995:65-727(-)